MFLGPVILVARNHLNQWLFRDHQNIVVATNNNSSSEPLKQNDGPETTEMRSRTIYI